MHKLNSMAEMRCKKGKKNPIFAIQTIKVYLTDCQQNMTKILRTIIIFPRNDTILNILEHMVRSVVQYDINMYKYMYMQEYLRFPYL